MRCTRSNALIIINCLFCLSKFSNHKKHLLLVIKNKLKLMESHYPSSLKSDSILVTFVIQDIHTRRVELSMGNMEWKGPDRPEPGERRGTGEPDAADAGPTPLCDQAPSHHHRTLHSIQFPYPPDSYQLVCRNYWRAHFPSDAESAPTRIHAIVPDRAASYS